MSKFLRFVPKGISVVQFLFTEALMNEKVLLQVKMEEKKVFHPLKKKDFEVDFFVYIKFAVISII